jgi:hypothetical protein
MSQAQRAQSLQAVDPNGSTDPNGSVGNQSGDTNVSPDTNVSVGAVTAQHTVLARAHRQ